MKIPEVTWEQNLEKRPTLGRRFSGEEGDGRGGGGGLALTTVEWQEKGVL